eukprot:CAMPEP_0172622216 /NCGR_PEP_ID=MMETSP1068-20121228/118859_1 /TAXON_ID=35684 /ORGANISM="Pseudopedinella elastica, Strain CCMP716" /LENGTH=270 /DNA_ID=CAMNT_0013430315 /DNA_START=87 /DNA_END=899 /DNA_ORIENTATION=+
MTLPRLRTSALQDESSPTTFKTTSRRNVLGGAVLLLPMPLAAHASPAKAAATDKTSASPATPPAWVTSLEAKPPPNLALDVYALVTPKGEPLVAVDLDGKMRVRTVAFFFFSKAEAERELKEVKKVSPKVASNAVVTSVPFVEALPLIYQPLFKVKGLPGYTCYRPWRGAEVTGDALRISGLENIGDRAVPVFYSQSGDIYLRYSDYISAGGDPKAAAVGDLGRLAISWAENPSDNSLRNVVPPKEKKRSSFERLPYLSAERKLALEWDI